MITVAELIEQLKKLPQQHIALVSMDPEGNGFHTVDSINEGHWDPKWQEYFSHEEDLKDRSTNAICIWP